GIGDRARGQISAQAGIVWLQTSVISPADERRREGVEQARFIRTCSLVEITRILMQDGGKDGTPNHDIGQTICIGCAETLAIAFRPLLIVVEFGCLIKASHHGGAEKGNGVNRGLESQVKLQLRWKRYRVAVIDDVEVGDEAQDALLLLHLDLLPGY